MTRLADPLRVLRAEHRGVTRLDWLHSRHAFSFGRYHDPQRMGFRGLRVINDDVVAPGGGFGEHPHRDMEILTWVLDGELAHGDSLGSDDVLKPGELQAMTAGSGITHRELNASRTEPVHFLQVWLLPRAAGVTPRYEQRAFAAAGRADRWQALASGGDDATETAPGPVPIDAEARLCVADLTPGRSLQLDTAAGRHGYLHLATGRATLGEIDLAPGDAAQWSAEQPLQISLAATEPAQALWFDLG